MESLGQSRRLEVREKARNDDPTLPVRLSDHTEVLNNIACSSSFLRFRSDFLAFFRSYFELQNFWILRNLIKQLFHSRLLDITLVTVIEKDHLGDWSPEKDCC